VGKNVAVFVDVANIFYAAKAAGVDIDYVTLLKSATAGRDLVRAYAYTGLDPDNENQRNFHDFLRRHGFKVVSKDIRKYGDGKVKANLDIELVVDMLKTARNLDIAIVISGDGDFAPAIRAVQEMGVRVEVISFRGNTSSDLMDVADQFSDIAALAKVEKGSSRSGRRVAGDDADLSMTAVPEKQSEGGGGTARARGRGRGRTRAPDAEPATRTAQPARESDAVGSAGTIVALPGEKLSRARRTAPVAAPAEADTGLEETAAAASAADDRELGDEATDEAGRRRRRRRRGGRGRGRGRDVTETGTETEAAADVGATEGEETAESEEPRPPVRANSTFGSIWDSQLGVSPAHPAATPGRPAAAEVEDLDEPPIPEYLIAERRGRQGGGGPVHGRGPRGARGAYAAALDRERFGGGGRGGGGVSSVPGGSRYAEPPPRGGGGGRGGGRRPEFRDARPPRSGGGGFGSGNEPWSEVPPELEAVLRAQLAARRPTPAPESVRSAAPETSSDAAPTTRRPTGRPSARRTAPPATTMDATTEPTAAPKRRPSRRAATAPSPFRDGETAGVTEAAAPKPRTTRTATTSKASATAPPKRRTTRKAASPDAG